MLKSWRYFVVGFSLNMAIILKYRFGTLGFPSRFATVSIFLEYLNLSFWTFLSITMMAQKRATNKAITQKRLAVP